RDRQIEARSEEKSRGERVGRCLGAMVSVPKKKAPGAAGPDRESESRQPQSDHGTLADARHGMKRIKIAVAVHANASWAVGVTDSPKTRLATNAAITGSTSFPQLMRLMFM